MLFQIYIEIFLISDKKVGFFCRVPSYKWVLHWCLTTAWNGFGFAGTIWSCAGFCGCIYTCLCLWDSTLWFLNQPILEISDSCINIYSLCKNLLKLTFFLICSCRFAYPHSTCLTWSHGTQWSLMSYFFCEHHLKDMVRRRTLYRQNTFHVLKPHFRWENLKHQVSLNELLFYYQIYIYQN